MFKKRLEELSDIALDILWEKNDYTPVELSNAVLILMEVFMSKMYDKYAKEKKDFSNIEEQAEKAGKELHDLILKFTWVDLKKVYVTKSI